MIAIIRYCYIHIGPYREARLLKDLFIGENICKSNWNLVKYGLFFSGAYKWTADWKIFDKRIMFSSKKIFLGRRYCYFENIFVEGTTSVSWL